MACDFALILSHTGIQLVERPDAGGWYELGHVALDAADLPAAMANLRRKVDQDTLVVRLVLPNAQIRYMELPRDESGLDAVREALDGATPYALDDLVFDYETDAAGTHIAAVARETLDEASDFAQSHGFTPLCFTAIAPEGSFAREVFFGLAPGAEAAVPSGQFIGPDDSPLEISDRPRPVATPKVTAPATPQSEEPSFPDAAPKASPDLASEPEPLFAAPDRADPEAPSKEAPAPDLLFVSRNQTKAPAPPSGQAQPAATQKQGETATSPDPVSEPAPLFASRSRRTTATPEAPTPQGRPAIFAHNRRGATPSDSPQPPRPPKDKAPASAHKRSALSPGAAAAFETQASASVMQPVAPPLPPARKWPRPALAGAAALALVVLGGAYLFGTFEAAPEPTPPAPSLVQSPSDAPDATAPVAPAAAPAPAPAPVVASTGTILSLDEAQRRYAATGVWQRAPGTPERGRLSEAAPDTPSPLALTARPQVPQIDTAQGADAAPATPPAPPPPGAVFTLDENGLIAATPEGVVTPAGAFVRLGRPEISPPTRPGTAPPAPDTPVATPAPDASAPAVPDAQPAGPIVTEGAPPAVPPTRPGTVPPEAQAQPAPQQTTDAVATQDGVSDQPTEPLSAQGALDLIEGAPPVSPPTRPGTPAPAPTPTPAPGGTPASQGGVSLDALTPVVPGQAEPAAPEPDATAPPEAQPQAAPDDTTQGALDLIEGAPPVSPPTRPGTPAPTRSGALAQPDGGVSLAALGPAPLRPRLRPAGLAPPPAPVVEIPDPFASGTAQAVATSLRPDGRPASMPRLVAAARAAQPSRTAQPTPVTAATITTVRPSGPVGGTVAARATQEGALPLNRTALIGVFGSSSNRRALVRLTNGRLVRVTVGDSLDGGRVSAINTSELLYTRGGRTIRLAMP